MTEHGSLSRPKMLAMKIAHVLSGEDMEEVMLTLAVFAAGMLHQSCKDLEQARTVLRGMTDAADQMLQEAFPNTSH